MPSSFFLQFTSEVIKNIIVIFIIIITSSIHAINKAGISLWNYLIVSLRGNHYLQIYWNDRNQVVL